MKARDVFCKACLQLLQIGVLRSKSHRRKPIDDIGQLPRVKTNMYFFTDAVRSNVCLSGLHFERVVGIATVYAMKNDVLENLNVSIPDTTRWNALGVILPKLNGLRELYLRNA